MITLPMFDAPFFKYSTVLTENEFILWFKWNTRGEYWTMDIYDIDENPLILGVKLIIGYPLLTNRGYKIDGPPGDFWVLDTSIETMFVEPGRNDFTNNRGIVLIYVGADE